MGHELLDAASARAQVADGVGLVAIRVGIVHQAPSALSLAADLKDSLVRQGKQKTQHRAHDTLARFLPPGRTSKVK